VGSFGHGNEEGMKFQTKKKYPLLPYIKELETALKSMTQKMDYATKLLKKLEWSGSVSVDYGMGHDGVERGCPYCLRSFYSDKKRHREDCILNSILTGCPIGKPPCSCGRDAHEDVCCSNATDYSTGKPSKTSYRAQKPLPPLT
jgi:hypothetical protein